MGTYDLARFRDAQDRGFGAPGSDYASALAEVRAGRKRSHWIWYVFPQVQGLGRSDFCHRYGVWGLGEASAYLADVCLRGRLVEICRALLSLDTRDAVAVFGRIDARKVRSSMTLFALADGADPVFMQVLDEFYGGQPDELTLDILGVAWPQEG